MVLINIYGKIEPIIISKKLGVGLCNPALDWIEELQDDFREEILVHKHDIMTYEKSGCDMDQMAERYNLEHLVKQAGWVENNKPAMQIIAERLIEIQVSDFDNSWLQMKNECMDSPTCEPQYTRKFLNFCHLVQSSKSARDKIPMQVPFSTYNSDDYLVKPLIINFLESMITRCIENRKSVKELSSATIKSLESIGSLVDNFLTSSEDFWLLDYIMNAVFSSNDYNAYYIFKVMSLIEMLLVNPKSQGKTAKELEEKLPQFISDQIIPEKHALYVEIMRKLRNKIGHGDFRAANQLLEQYRQSFMESFEYDEYEYSIESWTYLSIGLSLKDTFNEILWLMLSNKEKLLILQKS